LRDAEGFENGYSLDRVCWKICFPATLGRALFLPRYTFLTFSAASPGKL
jgi:hypothetical protein